MISIALVPLSTSCNAFGGGMSDEDALKSIRDLSGNGKLPPENMVLDIENRFSRSKVGALAKLMRGRIRFESGDYAAAAAILDSAVFGDYTVVPDYALWLRARSLQASGNHQDAATIFRKLIDGHPEFPKTSETRIAWAASAVEAGLANDVPAMLTDLVNAKNSEAMLLTGKAFKLLGVEQEASRMFRAAYFYGVPNDTSTKAASAYLTEANQSLSPQNAEEVRASADAFAKSGGTIQALDAYATLLNLYPASVTPEIQLKRIQLLVSLKRFPEASSALASIPNGSNEKENAYSRLISGHVKSRNWEQVRTILTQMLKAFPNSNLVPKAYVEAGLAARDVKLKTEEGFFLGEAVKRFPSAVEVAGAQFELAWLQHEAGDYSAASDMLIEHLARYTDRDTTYRGRAGYWAARNSERAGKIPEACALYDALIYRYAANWYGYLGLERLNNLRADNKCLESVSFPADSSVSTAIRNLKKVTAAPERSTEKDIDRIVKATELGSVGLFDWAETEIHEAQRSAGSSPKISMATAKYHRMKGDNTSAFLALAKSYPDYAQMFPEEMTKEEWSIFYPLTNWKDITYWAGQRGIDPYKVAGLIRQESVFNPRAKSSANAFGMMQLLLATARAVAKKHNATTEAIFPENLYEPALNIELGTAYMKDQLDKYGRLEYMAAAYNAGPGRVVQWKQNLPLQIDEFVEAIPFRETRMYVQGVIRNSAQYKRLYDENGNFRSNVGTRPLRAELDSKSVEQLAQKFPEVSVTGVGEE